MTIRPSVGQGRRPLRVPNPTAGASIPPLGGGDPRQLSLLGLELADERLEALSGFRQFTHDPLVIGALVAHLREDHPPLRRLAIDLRLLLLGLVVEARELPLLRLLTTLAIGQSLRRPTILLNQAGVQGRKTCEVPHGSGAGHRIVAAQDHRQGTALRVHAVQRPQPAGERVDLAGALALELPDLAAEGLDLGLGLLDAHVQPRDLLLLAREALLDRLELGEQRPLAGARRRDALLFFLQLLLRLLELSLLGLQGIVALRPWAATGATMQHREQGHEHAAAHGSRRGSGEPSAESCRAAFRRRAAPRRRRG